MSAQQELQEWYGFNLETVEALHSDGSNPEAAHTIEYHFAGQDFDLLEKAAVDAFKAGFEVTDAEELILDDGGTIFCFDAIAERKLDVSLINQDTDKLLAIANKHGVHYDGWGTYFIE
ncbi:ribonuclease E inhibitor RraB [Aestuariibacter halophilus]|uniref:Regulator of ribonuclease activity B n=1 Tax=Fluctibacter halophilus TaxID=226011 RepID=A0ABS8GBY6_9ALTE|nr:ribonuclease E inhibitor RraB [Aestuariibacter halophilus]MCC2617325.1 ribonuclease E inhibitor RraB [Aestuariibacter halophilus]